MIETLPTIYGPMAVYSTDTTQYPWLRDIGASVEDHHIDAVRDILKERPKGVFIDVGASYGCWSMALADLAEHVIAIEPQSKIFQLLCGNLGVNEATCVRMAAWSKGAFLRLPAVDYEAETNFGGISVSPTFGPDEIEARTLDQIVEMVLPECHVSFIKIDVEGSEREVLLGAMETIRRCRPVLFVEHDHACTHKEGLRQQIEAMSYSAADCGFNFLCLPL